ncbi:MAG TPA: hypothetical protein VFW00_12775 [Rhodocyclaceae bacterium]|nr:hypothetical protein [Rhodocyclaceae bacterium]
MRDQVTLNGLPDDPLLQLASRDVQQQAARLVQESFVTLFRLSMEGTEAQRPIVIAKLAKHLQEWSRMTTEEAAQLRMALLLTGLDQWGVAFSQAFGSGALTGLTILVSVLREGLKEGELEACQRCFDIVQGNETSAFDFKVELRRELHLALWHAMIAAEDREDALAILRQIGGMMMALIRVMPTQGWRLVADALASIQIRCLSHSLAVEGLAQEMTEELFAALAHELPESVRETIMQTSSRTVVAWQQARRAKEQLH